ncbi:MAG TPA: NAD(P)-dependent oxidoreductase [Verrucomicrobiae bacterium]|nr:NAD(P)-dependent oxidoreductase [Verrucomicrobiae bacterium]
MQSTYPSSNGSLVTILGATGFIGSHLVKKVEELGKRVFAPGRDEDLKGKDLGDVIYCIGLTSDFREYPLETVDAHVCHLSWVLGNCDFRSLLYLSSTRIYKGNNAPAREEDGIQLSPMDPDNLYNASKTMGESLCFSCGKKTRVARISNVYGNDFESRNFLSAIIKGAVTEGKVIVREPPDTERDYISVQDVVSSLIRIAIQGKQRLYNLASGVNVSNLELTQRIAELTGCQIVFDPAVSPKCSPRISIDRIRSEFNFRPATVLEELGGVIDSYKTRVAKQPPE